MTGMANVTKLAGETVGQEFLVFTLGDEEYGIDILKVQEIRGYDQVTRIANTPAFIKGVTNLRGVIVPIIDLRIKFAQPGVEYNDNTVVIVLNLVQRVVGIVVDGVSDVLSLTADQIRPSPEFAVTMSTEYLTGLGALGDRMLIRLTSKAAEQRGDGADGYAAQRVSRCASRIRPQESKRATSVALLLPALRTPLCKGTLPAFAPFMRVKRDGITFLICKTGNCTLFLWNAF